MRCLWPRQIGNTDYQQQQQQQLQQYQQQTIAATAAITTSTACRASNRFGVSGQRSGRYNSYDGYVGRRNGGATCNPTANTLMNNAGGSMRCARYVKRSMTEPGQRGMQVTMANYNQKDYDIYYYEHDEYEDETVIIDTIAVTATTTTQLMESGCGGVGANCQKCRNIKILLRLSLRYFYDINCEIVKNTI
uniref:Uncharacterized protein n=1 Tax=Bactrocera latifrons TaxID=174628 RepID=A0A0K8UKF4_BACLA